MIKGELMVCLGRSMMTNRASQADEKRSPLLCLMDETPGKGGNGSVDWEMNVIS